MALGSVVLFGAGALRLADWLHDRRAMAAPPAPAAAAPERPAPPVDPRMAVYLDEELEYGPARATSFLGAGDALFAVARSVVHPHDAFARLLARLGPDTSGAAVRAELRRGPSAEAALRLQASVGAFPGGAFFVRLPPDAAAAKEGRCRVEPGGVVLAVPDRSAWAYLLFFFPQGLDLDRLARDAAPPPGVLRPLGPAAERVLEPALAVGDGRPRTVLCRARGTSGEAVDAVARDLERRGWTLLPERESPAGAGSVCLVDGEDTVCLAPADPAQVGGLVTVFVDSR
jgi:hypothetical protein